MPRLLPSSTRPPLSELWERSRSKVMVVGAGESGENSKRVAFTSAYERPPWGVTRVPDVDGSWTTLDGSSSWQNGPPKLRWFCRDCPQALPGCKQAPSHFAVAASQGMTELVPANVGRQVQALRSEARSPGSRVPGDRAAHRGGRSAPGAPPWGHPSFPCHPPCHAGHGDAPDHARSVFPGADSTARDPSCSAASSAHGIRVLRSSIRAPRGTGDR